MTSPSFSKLLTDTLSVKRSGQSGLELVSADVPCVPFEPVSDDVQARISTQVGIVILETFVDGAHDIRRGDTVVYRGGDYSVRESKMALRMNRRHLRVEKVA